MTNAEISTRPIQPASETRRRGESIYKRHIQVAVENDHIGEIVAIDVDSEMWAIGGTVREAAEKLRKLHSDVKNVWLVRVGYRGLRSFGAGSPRRVE